MVSQHSWLIGCGIWEEGSEEEADEKEESDNAEDEQMVPGGVNGLGERCRAYTRLRHYAREWWLCPLGGKGKGFLDSAGAFLLTFHPSSVDWLSLGNRE